jgi:hypothetical protein
MVIFHSYASLPEGIYGDLGIGLLLFYQKITWDFLRYSGCGMVFFWEIWGNFYYLHWMLGLPMFPSIAANAGMRLYQVEYDGIYN